MDQNTTKRPTWRLFRDKRVSPQQLLNELRITSAPVPVFGIARLLGVEVHRVREPGWNGALQTTEDRAICWLKASDPEYRQRFTLAHELGHLMLHELGTVFRDATGYRSDDHREHEANRFAARLLMPRSLLVPAFHRLRDLDDLATLFNVSEQARSIRLRSLNLI